MTTIFKRQKTMKNILVLTGGGDTDETVFATAPPRNL